MYGEIIASNKCTTTRNNPIAPDGRDTISPATRITLVNVECLAIETAAPVISINA